MPGVTIALDVYDRHLPFFDGSVKMEGLDANFMAVGQSSPLLHGKDRHKRMLVDQEFDIAEVSLSSYIVAKNKGLPITANPVFPTRLLSISQMWPKSDSGLTSPKDLLGRSVGLSSFQTTLSVLAKGDIGREYGAPWREIKWVTTSDEAVSAKAGEKEPFERSKKKIFDLLRDRDVDAIFVPHPPKKVLEDTQNYRRLFLNSKEEEIKYFSKNGYFPIMHVFAIKESTLSKIPKLPSALFAALKRAKEVCESRYEDPNWSYLAWGRLHIEEQNRILGRDVWADGVSKNKKNLERFIEYSHDQELVDSRVAVDELFHDSTIDS